MLLRNRGRGHSDVHNVDYLLRCLDKLADALIADCAACTFEPSIPLRAPESGTDEVQALRMRNEILAFVPFEAG